MKKTKLSLMALATMMLASATIVGCSQKNYDADIDSLKKEITDSKTAIAALQAAMASGKMITSVEKTETGYKITLSDKTVMLLNGSTAAAPQLRINAAKNWEMSTDNGKTWAEIKDAAGNPIAETKAFVKDYVKINADGYLVIGDKTTTFKYDIMVPTVTLLNDELIALITVPNADGTVSTARVPMEGYFDKWSVTGIKAASNTDVTLAIKRSAALAADVTIGGKAYKAGEKVYSSEGVNVMLNPSKIDARAIAFEFVAVLDGGVSYALPLGGLKAVPYTGVGISAVTKAADLQMNVWNIGLGFDSIETFDLRGTADNVALCAHNSNGTQTFSDYAFEVTVEDVSAAGNASAVVDAVAIEGGVATIAPAATIVASTLYATSDVDASKIVITREDGTLLTDQKSSMENYTGKYLVRMATPASRAAVAAPDVTTINVTYAYIGQDGKKATKAVDVKFQADAPVADVIEVPVATFKSSGLNKTDITYDIDIAALKKLFEANPLAQKAFEDNSMNFDVKLDASAPKTVKVEYYNSSSQKVVPPVANLAAFAKATITVPQAALLADAQGKINLNCEYGLTYYMNGAVPGPQQSIKVTLLLDGTSPATAADLTATKTIANSATTVDVVPADVVYKAEADNVVTDGVTKLVAALSADASKVTATLAEDGKKITLTRVGDAPDENAVIGIKYTVKDGWGKQHEFTSNVTIAKKADI